MPSSCYIDNTPSKSPQHPSERKNGFNKQPDKPKKEVPCDCEVSVEKLCSQESLTALIEVLDKDVKKLEVVSKFVQIHKEELIKWKNSAYYLLLGDLDDTIYMGEEYMQEAWEEVYLPKITRMQVFGTLEHSKVMVSCMQWIILVGEDGCVYAYMEEKLQLIAKSLREFVENGKKKTYLTYNYPEFSEEEDESLEEDEEILKIRQETKDFVDKSADELEDFLKFVSKS
ncbi:uncharacterized protein LOC122940872 [Bufo gargarizans]|uniref:uncharacterized protein LOC122940872 n=1 Tax=Bufo gargarizans TaxID=30331 RepID=UPI001CF56F3E|nr:uncharacterized protein LOC122940872 [Bufo gargarizans]